MGEQYCTYMCLSACVLERMGQEASVEAAEEFQSIILYLDLNDHAFKSEEPGNDAKDSQEG